MIQSRKGLNPVCRNKVIHAVTSRRSQRRHDDDDDDDESYAQLDYTLAINNVN